jgi:hypothetical protein
VDGTVPGSYPMTGFYISDDKILTNRDLGDELLVYVMSENQLMFTYCLCRLGLSPGFYCSAL